MENVCSFCGEPFCRANGRFNSHPAFGAAKEVVEDKMKAAAVITIRDASKMTPKGRARVARWIDQQKKFFVKEHKNLSRVFTARYICKEA